MGIRAKTSLIILITLVVMGAIQFWVAQRVIQADLAEVEKKWLQSCLQSFEAAVDSRLQDLVRLASQQSYQPGGLTGGVNSASLVVPAEELLQHNGLAAVAVTDRRGTILWAQAADRSGRQPALLPAGFEEHLLRDGQRFESLGQSFVARGTVALQDGICLLASHPVRLDRSESPAWGFVFLLQRLEAADAARLLVPSNCSLMFWPVDGKDLPEDAQVAARILAAGAKYYQTTSPGGAESWGYTVRPDLLGRPAVLAKIVQPARFAREAARSRNVMLGHFSITGVLLLIITLAMMNRIIISRLAALTSDIRRIQLGGKVTERVRVRGRDEITALAESMNTLLSAVDEAQGRLSGTEAYYRSLIAHSYDALLICDENLQLRFGSPSLERLTGYTFEKLSGRDLRSVLPPAELPKIGQMIEQLLTSPGRSVPVEVRFRHQNGSERVFESIASNYLADPAVAGFVLNVRDITDRKEVEAALQRSCEEMESKVEARTAELSAANERLVAEMAERERIHENLVRLEKAIANITLGITVTDASGRVIYANPAEVMLRGCRHLDPAESDGPAPESPVAACEPSIERLLEIGDWKREHICVKQDGVPFHAQLITSLVRNERGEPIGTVTSCEDISERKRAEREIQVLNQELEERVRERTVQLELMVGRLEREIENRELVESALRESDQKHRFLFDQMPIGLYKTTPAGEIHEMNPAMLQMLRVPEGGRAYYQSARQFWWDPEERHQWLVRVDRSGELHGAEVRWRRFDGSGFWVRWHARAFRNEQGQVAYYKGSVEDISEAKAAADELRETHQKMEALFQSSPLGIIIFDADRRIRSWNEAASLIFGWTEPEVLGKTVDELHPEKMHAFREVRDQIQHRMNLSGFELQWQRRDGTQIELSLSTTVLTDPAGQHLYTMAMVQDITERKRIEQQLAQAEKMKALGHFASGIAHDFNNLVMVIAGTSELLLMDLPPDSRFRNDLGTILRTAKRASELSHSLLGFARKQVLRKQNIDLTMLVGDLVPMLRRLIPENIAIQLAPELDEVIVNADPGQIEGVLLNLVVNARDAMPEGGVIRIDVHSREIDEEYIATHPWSTAGRYGCISVTDDGHGMDQVTLARVFEPFFTTKETGKGTGLGLSSVYGIVKQHGGMIDVESAPGKGSVFRVYLPAGEEPSRVSDTLGVALKVPARGSILVVEDHDDLRTLVSRFLETLGYTVRQARDGLEAMDLLDGGAHRFDLVIADVVMPRMGGLELCEQQLKKQPNLAFLLTSGYSDEVAKLEAIRKLGVGYLPKPYEIAELAAKIREMFEVCPRC